MSDQDPYASLATPIQADPYASIAVPVSSAPEKPGYFKRLGQSLGLPTSMEELEAAKPSLKSVAETAALPIIAGPKLLYNYGKTAARGIAEGAKEAYEAGGNVGEGQDVLPNLWKAAHGFVHAALQSTPIIGPSIETAGNDIHDENYSGAAGGLTGVIGQVAAPELLEKAPAAVQSLTTTAKELAVIRSLVDGPPESLMTQAIKPGKNNVGWNADVQKALPNIKAAEEQLGRPIAGLDDALEATAHAKKSIWKQYVDRLTPAAKMGAQIDGNAIADAMVNSIDKRTALQNPGLVEKVKATADTYRRPIGLDEAEDFLQSANKDLNSYYAKNKVGRQVALNDPSMSSTVAEAEALRDGLYSKLDDISGPGTGDLKKQYGALTNIEKEMTGRKLVADRQQPNSLSEQIGMVRGAGKMARGCSRPVRVSSSRAPKELRRRSG